MPPDATAFDADWIDAWNRRDLEAILAHYAEEIEFQSPFALRLLDAKRGLVRGKASLRDYFQRGLARYPDLRFRRLGIFSGVESLTLWYESVEGTQAAEVMTFDAEGLVVRVQAH